MTATTTTTDPVPAPPSRLRTDPARLRLLVPSRAAFGLLGRDRGPDRRHGDRRAAGRSLSAAQVRLSRDAEAAEREALVRHRPDRPRYAEPRDLWQPDARSPWRWGRCCSAPRSARCGAWPAAISAAASTWRASAVIEFLQSFPDLILAMAIAMALGGGLMTVIVADRHHPNTLRRPGHPLRRAVAEGDAVCGGGARHRRLAHAPDVPSHPAAVRGALPDPGDHPSRRRHHHRGLARLPRRRHPATRRRPGATCWPMRSTPAWCRRGGWCCSPAWRSRSRCWRSTCWATASETCSIRGSAGPSWATRPADAAASGKAHGAVVQVTGGEVAGHRPRAASGPRPCSGTWRRGSGRGSGSPAAD